MAILEIKKIKAKTPSGKWFTCNVAEIKIIHGQIFFVPENRNYTYFNLNASNVIIVK